MEKQSLNALIEKSLVDHWNLDAFTDYQGSTLQYHDVARKIEKIHIMFEACDIQRGDKIAICGRNSSAWACTFLAILTYGAVAVPILHEFTPEQIHNTVNHSEAKMLFVGDIVAKQIDAEQMPNLEAVIYLPDNSLLIARTERLYYVREHLNEIYGRKYPKYFRQQHVKYYHEQSPDELALINYTSGTTGYSKGVMVPYRALMGNMNFMVRELKEILHPGSRMICMLPMAHMYGLSVEFIFNVINGTHLFFLNRLPSPAVIIKAFADIKPNLIVSVPLIIEKIVKKKIFPIVQESAMKVLLNMPIINGLVEDKIRDKVIDAFGGQFYEIIIGGAPLNNEVDKFLRKIGFPYTVGYGTTECAPLISYADYKDFISGSCGKAIDGMDVEIDSTDPINIPGEILVKGQNVMLGYYKDEKVTGQAIDEDGWYHTGDLGVIDYDGNIFIKGRSKNVLIAANGQNIYPEEIEDKLNSLTLVSECLVVQRGDRFVALVYPDYKYAEDMGLSREDIQKVMDDDLRLLNTQLQAYSRISSIEIQEEEFAKTAKRSIKRFLYK